MTSLFVHLNSLSTMKSSLVIKSMSHDFDDLKSGDQRMVTSRDLLGTEDDKAPWEAV
jgi:hypothetical protein